MPRSPVVFAVALALLAALPGLAAAQGQGGPGPVDAAAWAVLDADEGEILGSSAAGERRPVASATKLMTALVAAESRDTQSGVKFDGYETSNPAESVAGLEQGETYTQGELLHALLMVSANDAAAELARSIGGEIPRFVELMNRKARQLGLEDTHFTNPIGLDEPGNYSTAADLARLTAEVLSNPALARIVDTEKTVIGGEGARPIELVNTNPLLATHPWVDGVKTGQTLGAGWVLIASGEREGAELIAVVLGSSSEQSREQAALELLDWGFGLYDQRVVAGRLAPVGRVEIAHTDGGVLPVLAARRLVVRVRDDAAVATKLDVPDPIEGPIGRGKRVGRVIALSGGERLAAVPVVASRAVGAPSLSHTSTPLLVGALAAIAVLVIIAAVAGARARARG